MWLIRNHSIELIIFLLSPNSRFAKTLDKFRLVHARAVSLLSSTSKAQEPKSTSDNRFCFYVPMLDGFIGFEATRMK